MPQDGAGAQETGLGIAPLIECSALFLAINYFPHPRYIKFTIH